MKFSIPTNLKQFDFQYILFSHGWIFLSPFCLSEDRASFCRVDRLSPGRNIKYQLSSYNDKGSWHILVDSSEELNNLEKLDLINRIRYMFRLDENFSEFYNLCKTKNRLHFTCNKGGGRMLRSATIFEDLVKTLCTTNTSWTNTKQMVNNLVEKIGMGSFPAAEDIIQFGKQELKKIGLGYRTDYLFEICQRIELGEFRIDSDFLLSLHRNELRKMLLSIKGFGDYAVNHMMVILGHYQEIPVDSEVTKYFKEVLCVKINKKTHSEDIFEEWGGWKYLAYKFDRIERKFNFIDNVTN